MALTLRRGSSLVALFAALLVVVALGIAVGSVNLPLGSVLTALIHPHATGDVTAIVWALRLPRVLIAVLVGAALGVSGSLLQGMLRNGLVDPYLTGGSAGAAFMIALAIALGLPAPLYAALLLLAILGVGLYACVLLAEMAAQRWYGAPFVSDGFA